MPGHRGFCHQAILLICLAWPGLAWADDATALKLSGCKGIAALVDAAAPSGAVFLPSFPTAEEPALLGSAFVYDNALAVVALISCGDVRRAARVGAALRIAAMHDRFWRDGRLRNAYRAGAVREGVAPALPGWWDAAARRWDEDAYQVGTATGNVAWAALALIALGRAEHLPADREAAAGLMMWVAGAVATSSGYAGGFFGEEPGPVRLGWVSTEHNVDAAAAFSALGMGAEAARARGFVGSMWDAAGGRFWMGTGADGRGINRSESAIDAELWPLIGVSDPPADWQRAKAWVRGHHSIGGGYGFRDGPDGVWTEGTAQAALVLPDAGVFGLLRGQVAADGLLYASPQDRVRTGLALRPDSVTDDFYYFHLPHLGATAWAVLAAGGVNPFRP